MSNNIERRFSAELRVGQSQGDEFALVGYAARFNSISKDLGGFKECIAPKAFARALASNASVFCLFNHDQNKVLGRTPGTLRLSEDANGLKFRCQLDPLNPEHVAVYRNVKLGNVGDCSFAFTPIGEDGDAWEDRKDDQGRPFILRTLKDVNLYDVSVCTHGAYSEPSVQAREDNLTPEVRSHIATVLDERAKKTGQAVLSTLGLVDKANKDKLAAIGAAIRADEAQQRQAENDTFFATATPEEIIRKLDEVDPSPSATPVTDGNPCPAGSRTSDRADHLRAVGFHNRRCEFCRNIGDQEQAFAHLSAAADHQAIADATDDDDSDDRQNRCFVSCQRAYSFSAGMKHVAS
jgi:hypothetical protein